MASVGDDWQTNPATQIKWGLGYIKGRYRTPCKAWAHSQARAGTDRTLTAGCVGRPHTPPSSFRVRIAAEVAAVADT